MIHEVRLPRLGETVDEVEVLGWSVEEGARIAVGDALLSVATDKVDTEVPAPLGGIVTDLMVEVGSVITTGTVICRIEQVGAPEPGR